MIKKKILFTDKNLEKLILIQKKIEKDISSNEEIFLVWWCVRDLLLKKEINDYDLTGKIKPEKFASVFGGTITDKMWTVFFTFEWLELEYTPYRKEGDYNGRKPWEVSFSEKIEEDYIRRDFTINALYYSLKTQEILDYCDWIKDLENKLIRTVLNPIDRFNEDYLRILRWIRFSIKYWFKIEEKTEQAMNTLYKKINELSWFRIKQELFKWIKYKWYLEQLLKYWILETIFPIIWNMRWFDQKTKHHQFDLLTHSLKAFNYYLDIQENIDYYETFLIWALLHDCWKVKQVTECWKFAPWSEEFRKAKEIYTHEKIWYTEIKENLDKLCFSNEEQKIIEVIILFHQNQLFFSDRINYDKSFKKNLRKVLSDIKNIFAEKETYDFIFELNKISLADKMATWTKNDYERWYKEFNEKIAEIKKEGEIPTVNNVALNWNELMKMWFQWKEIWIVKEKCLEYILENPVNNNIETLKKYVKEIFKK